MSPILFLNRKLLQKTIQFYFEQPRFLKKFDVHFCYKQTKKLPKVQKTKHLIFCFHFFQSINRFLKFLAIVLIYAKQHTNEI